MKIKLLRPFQIYRRGDCLDMADGQANAWITMGIAAAEESVVVETAAVETAAVEQKPVRRATIMSSRGQRK
jgi:hypothetical protein